jgi:lysophospholipid acyltransferase (LPLAT)-like uncharacterized protein
MFFKPLKKKLVAALGPSLAYWVIKFLTWTMRFEEVNAGILQEFLEKGTPFIGTFWHGRLLMMPLIYRGKKLSILVSPHRDGQIVGKVLQRFGFHTIPGSTYRRGFGAFKQMVKALQNESDIVVVPDGPRGPRQQVQIGVIELAKRTGRPIVPVTFGASRGIFFKTWDRFLLPYPFSKGVYIYGDPVYVNPHGDRVHLEERRIILEKRLNELTDQADHYFDPPHPIPLPRGERGG